MCYYDAMIACS